MDKQKLLMILLGGAIVVLANKFAKNIFGPWEGNTAPNQQAIQAANEVLVKMDSSEKIGNFGYDPGREQIAEDANRIGRAFGLGYWKADPRSWFENESAAMDVLTRYTPKGYQALSAAYAKQWPGRSLRNDIISFIPSGGNDGYNLINHLINQ